MAAGFLSSIKANKIIVYNYSLMTIIQFLNSFFYILIFPFVITRVGVEGYGHFVYVTSFCLILTALINYGYDMLGLREASLSHDSDEKRSSIFSNIFICKVAILLISTIAYVPSVLWWVDDPDNRVLYFICYLSCTFTPFSINWFYQSIQRMQVPAFFQVISKLASLPFVFLYVQGADDVWIFALIVSFSSAACFLASFAYVFYKYNINFSGVSFSLVKTLTIEGMPFFLSNVTNTIKHRSVEILIGIYFGVTAVAVYDLANKIYSIPSLIATNLNAAIFPKLVTNKDGALINKIIRYEVLFSLFILVSIAVFGPFAVDYLSAGSLPDSYPVLVLMSFNIFAYLVVGCYIYFVFVPRKMYREILRIQIIATMFYMFGAACAIFSGLSYHYILVALVLSGLIEIFYSAYLSKAKNS